MKVIDTLISISDSQRRALPGANWRATIFHGLPEGLYKLERRPGKYLAFFGRTNRSIARKKLSDVAGTFQVRLRSSRSSTTTEVAANVKVMTLRTLATSSVPGL